MRATTGRTDANLETDTDKAVVSAVLNAGWWHDNEPGKGLYVVSGAAPRFRALHAHPDSRSFLTLFGVLLLQLVLMFFLLPTCRISN